MTKICPVCGKEFEPIRRQIYCSKTCRRKYYHQKYREEEASYKKKYYEAHQDYLKKYQKKYYQDHKERYKEYQKEYRREPYMHCQKPSNAIVHIRRKIIKRFNTEKPKYPCSAFHESRVARIPDKLCFNCYAERCRFEND